MKNSITHNQPVLSLCSFIFLAFSLLMIPTAVHAQVIYLTDTVIAPHEKIKLTFDSFPGNTNDYIALAFKVQAPGNYVGFYFLNGQKKGSLEFDGQTYGDYELRGFYSNTPILKTKLSFRIGNKDQTPKIISDKPVFLPSEKISISFSGFPGNESDWISIAQPGTPPSSYAEYIYLHKKQSGTLLFDVKPFGVYELRGYFNNEYVIQTTAQLIIGDQNLTITPDKQTFKSGEAVTLKFANFPGNQNDWISVSKAGSNAGEYVTFQYLNKQKSGTLTFNNVLNGDYELRGYVNGENVIRVKSTIKVGEGSAALINQTPGNINIQGVLTNASGVAVPNGSYIISFRLYDSQQSDSVRWEEKISNINVVSGVFSTVLGKIKPFNINFDKPYFLGIQVGSEQELKPRIELTSTPYSLMAKNVENNSISTEKIQPNAVTLDKIATPLLSSINGIANDGGNVNIVAGANVTIINDDKNKTITISAVNPGGGTTGISRINPGNAIAVTGQDGPTATISVAPNSIGNNELQPNAITTDKIVPNVVSSINGVTNDGGNVNLIAGANVSLAADNVNKTITISATGGGGGGGSGSIAQLTEGNGIGIQNPAGPITTIGLKPNILLGPSGSLGILNQNSTLVAGISSSINQGGSFSTSNAQGIQMFGVSNFSDGQPFLYMNSKLGRQIIDLKANELSDAEMNLKASTGNTVLRLTNETGGLVNVFNQAGNIAARLKSKLNGDGGLFVRTFENRPAIDLTTNDINRSGFLNLYNADGNEAVWISTFTNQQPYLTLLNRTGVHVAQLSGNGSGNGELFLTSSLKNPTVQLSAANDASGLVNVFNSNGLITTQITNSIAENDLKAGNGRLILNSVDNNKVLELQTNTTGGGRISLFNVEGNEALRLSTINTYGGSTAVFNRSGIVVGRLAATTQGNGRMTIYSRDDKEAGYIGVADGGGGLLRINDEKESEVVRVTTRETGGGSVRINNRLVNPVVRSFANEFSDGEIELNSVLNNPTLRLTANDNAGGLINVFNQGGQIAARLTEETGGKFSIFNTDETEMIQLSTLPDRTARIRVNNRLGTPVADLISNDFSDGQLTLSSVGQKPTLILKANENLGGLISLFSLSGKKAAELIEYNGFGHLDIYNPAGNHTAQLADFNDGGNLKLFNKDTQLIHNLSINKYQEGLFEIKSKLRLGENVMETGGNDDSEGHLYLFNRASKPAVYLSAAAGDGTVSLSDISGRIMSSMDGSRYGGSISLRNGDAKPVHYIGTNGKSQEGFYSIFSKTDINKNRLQMGGDSVGNGYLNIYNYNGLNTFFMGHNQFADGVISIKNNLGNLGALFEALKDGGSVTVTDGKPGTNHRGVLLNGLNGGKLNLFNNQTKLVGMIGVGDNGEGLWQVVSKLDLSKSRIEIGGDNTGSGFFRSYNGDAQKNTEIGTTEDKAGFLSTYSPTGKKQTYISPGGPGGGAVSVMNNTENIVGTMVYDGYGGTVFVTNKTNTGSAVMTHNTRGGRFFIQNTAGKTAGELSTATDLGGELNIFNATQINTARLAQSSNGSGILEVGTPTGVKVARVTALDGTGYIGVDNVDKNEVVRLTANTGKGGGIGVKNNLNKDIVTITQSLKSDGSILVYNASGNNTSAIAHFDDGRGKIEVGTADGTKVARMTANSDGSGFITVDNVDKLDVVRITANTGKGGGIGIRNNLAKDIIQLTQDNSSGIILVNNTAGGLLATITHNTGNGGFIGTKDQNGKDAVWINTSPQGGGSINTFNALGNIATVLNADAFNNGKISVNGSAGNELAQMTGSSDGTGLVNIFNSTGINLAGLKSNSTSGGGNLFAKNSTGKEVARMTTLANGNGLISIDNSTGFNLASLTTSNASGGGYVNVNTSAGKDVARMFAWTDGSGYMGLDNSSAFTVAYVASSSVKGGYMGVANASGKERARLFSTGAGGGYLGAYNPAGSEVSIITHTSDGEGYIGVTNNAGNERAYMIGGDFGGTMVLRDKSNNIRFTTNVLGIQADAVDGSRMTASPETIVLFDKAHFARAEVSGGAHISVKGPNGVEHSFMGSATAANFGYIGVCNSNIIGSPVKAGMYTNASNQGVLFADVKNFKMDYPGKPDKQIWYGSLEGPELAAYIRGTGKLINGKATIEFPDHYVQVANAQTMTVILTPLSGKSKGLAVVNKKTTGFEVEELMEGSGVYEFDWEVKCVRKGYENFEVVRNKSDEPKLLLPETQVSQSIETKIGNKIEVAPDIKVKIEATTTNN